MTYCVPDEYFFRIHHVRPRFKSNVEEVMLFMADTITSTGTLPTDDFKKFLIEEIYKFPGNSTLKLKTVQNWRTEISALFSLYFDKDDFSYPSPLAIDLSENQDLTKFFKYFLFSFQYPGGHIKPSQIKDQLDNQILFHPSKYILLTIQELKKIDSKQGYLTKAEACHMIFNDLRATKDNNFKNISEVANRIFSNRKNVVEYDQTGDVIRYAGDILDYMSLANLVKNYAGKFFINSNELKSIETFIKKQTYFNYGKNPSLKNISEKESLWVVYACEKVKEKIFDTDILAFIANDEKEYKQLQERTAFIQYATVPGSGTRTKDIGDYGESLVYGHECAYLKLNKREDLINWVKCIPNHFAAGYDIQSVDPSEIKRYIEVKSTISKQKLTFNRFKLTKNELSSAQTLGDNYFVYRLQFNKENEKSHIKLTIIKNPIKLFKSDEIDIDLTSGEVNLKSHKGKIVELLFWEK